MRKKWDVRLTARPAETGAAGFAAYLMAQILEALKSRGLLSSKQCDRAMRAVKERKND